MILRLSVFLRLPQGRIRFQLFLSFELCLALRTLFVLMFQFWVLWIGRVIVEPGI